jgi:hypothetical protein
VIKATSARIVLAFTVFALALPSLAPARDRPPSADQRVDQLLSPANLLGAKLNGGTLTGADLSPPTHAVDQIGAKCKQVSVLVVYLWNCGVGPEYDTHCFYGAGVGGGLDSFTYAVSFGHLYVEDPGIFNDTGSFQYNYAGPYTNVNFFANVTHRLGHFHGGGVPGGFAGIGGGVGTWGTTNPCPGSTPLAPITAHRQWPPPHGGSGHRSPAMTVAGFVKAFNHKNPRKACSYARPSLQGKCHRDFKRFRRFNVRIRHFKVVSSRRNGNRARVKVSGAECLGARCRPLRGGSGKRTLTVKLKRVRNTWYIR